MPEYRYLSSDGNGRYVWKSAVASNPSALEHELLNAEVPVLEIREAHPVAKVSSRKVPEAEKLPLMEQLETAFYVGMPLTKALDLGLISVKHKFFREVLLSIRENLDSGLPFSTALARWPGVFNGLERALIVAGDQAGIMTQSLHQINLALRRSVETDKRISSLLLYPKIVGVVMILVLGVLLGFTLPRFEGIFRASNVPLPGLTETLLHVSRFLGGHPAATVTLFSVLAVAFLQIPRIVPHVFFLHRFLLKIPVMGPFLRKSLACTFCRTFSQLLSANISILQALILCRDISWNAYYRDCIAQSCVLISIGRSVTAALEPLRPILGNELMAMLAFGEKTGSISDLLTPLSDRLEQDMTMQTERLKPVLEAGITVAIAIVIGTIVIAAVIPMFDMVKVFSQ